MPVTTHACQTHIIRPARLEIFPLAQMVVSPMVLPGTVFVEVSAQLPPVISFSFPLLYFLCKFIMHLPPPPSFCRLLLMGFSSWEHSDYHSSGETIICIVHAFLFQYVVEYIFS